MAESDLHRERRTDLQASYERSDLRPGYIAFFGIALSVVLVISVVIASLIVHYKTVQHARQDTPIPRLAREREATPGPRLQVEAHSELRQMRAAEDAALNNYGWVDKNAGIVRIPVDQAMEVLAKKGLPARKQQEKAR
jgi:hypothetical protein